jgi:hypothetical protein
MKLQAGFPHSQAETRMDGRDNGAARFSSSGSWLPGFHARCYHGCYHRPGRRRSGKGRAGDRTAGASMAAVELSAVDERVARMQRRFEWPVIVAALAGDHHGGASFSSQAVSWRPV